MEQTVTNPQAVPLLLAALVKRLEIKRDPDSIATVFLVIDRNTVALTYWEDITIELSEIGGDIENNYQDKQP